MFNLTRLVHLDTTDLETLRPRLSTALLGAASHVVAPTLPGSRNGGDLLVHARFDAEAARAAAARRLDAVLDEAHVSHVDGVDYETGRPPAPTAAGTVYRTLLLAAAPDTRVEVLAEFESDLLLLPRYVDTITTFQLSKPTRVIGTSRWTHVFEQEFTDEAGLMGPYLMHPIHWARVDRWFDPECPEYVVRERICHSYCAIDGPVLTG